MDKGKLELNLTITSPQAAEPFAMLMRRQHRVLASLGDVAAVDVAVWYQPLTVTEFQTTATVIPLFPDKM